MGLAAGCSDVVSARCSTEAARKAWTVVAGGVREGAPEGRGDDTCSVSSQHVLPAAVQGKKASPSAPLAPTAAIPGSPPAEPQAAVSRSRRRRHSRGSDYSRASSRSSDADSADSPRSSAASSTFTEDAGGSFSSSDEDGGAIVISQAGMEFVWHGEPLAPLRDVLASGKLRRKHQAALEAELDSLNEEALATSLAVAHGRQRLLPRGKPPRLLAPRELHWTVKKKPKLKHGASVTDASTVPPVIKDDWFRTGFRMLATSKVGVLLLLPSRAQDGLHLEEEKSGRQSLGPVSADVGLLSGKSPLRLLVERVRRLQHLAERQQAPTGRNSGCQLICRIPVYIMADAANKNAVEAYVQEQRHFGLEPSSIHVFAQPLDPIFDRTGHVLLAEPWHVGRAPGGSGALFEVLQRSGMREDMQKRRLSHIFVMPCNNLLGRVADPIFLGYASSLGAPCCLKVTVRTEGADPLGIFCTHHEHHDLTHPPEARVVEGFELHDSHRHQKDHDGHLRLRVVSLSQYVFPLSLFFTEDGGVPSLLPHAVPTSWPIFDPDSMKITEPKAGELNAIRLECFLSDLFSTLQRPDVPALLVQRAGEYAAAPTLQELRSGDRGVHKAVVEMSMLHQSWVAAAGGTFRDGTLGGAHGKDLCEVSPLVSYEGEGLDGYFHGEIDLPLHLSAQGERKAGTGTRMLALVKRPRASVGVGHGAGNDDGFAEPCSEGEELPPTPPSEPEEAAPPPPAPKRSEPQPEEKKAFSPRRSSPRYSRFSPRYGAANHLQEAAVEADSVSAPNGVRTSADTVAQSPRQSPRQEAAQQPRARHRASEWAEQLGSFSPPHAHFTGQPGDNSRDSSPSARTSGPQRGSSSAQAPSSVHPSGSSSAPLPGAGVWAWIEEELPKGQVSVHSKAAPALADAQSADGAQASVRQHRRSGRKSSRSSRRGGSSARSDDEAGGKSGRSSGRGSSDSARHRRK